MLNENMGLELNGAVPCAVLEKDFKIKYATKKYFDLVNSSGFISDYMDETQASLFTKTLSALKPDEKTDFVINIKISKNEALSLLCHADKIKDSEDFYVELLDFGAIKKEAADIFRENLMLRNEVSLIGCYSFSYISADDDFRLFYVNGEGETGILRGTLKMAETLVIKEKMVFPKDILKINKVFTDIKNGVQSFEYRARIISAVGDDAPETPTTSTLKTGEASMTGNECTQPEMYFDYIIRGKSYIIEKGNVITTGILMPLSAANGVSQLESVDKYLKDPLTGLLNKTEIVRYAQNVIKNKKSEYEKYKKSGLSEAACAAKTNIAFMVIDIDDFKMFNDSYGHQVGDEVLKNFADLLKTEMGKNGVVGRIGGDEFMVVLSNYEDESELRNYLHSFMMAGRYLMRDRLSGNGIKCSVGISQFPKDADSYDRLFNIADKSLYRAKEKGKACFIIFDIAKHAYLLKLGEDVIYRDANVHEVELKQLIDAAHKFNKAVDSEKNKEKPEPLKEELTDCLTESLKEYCEVIADYFKLERIDMHVGRKLELSYSYNPNCYPEISRELLKYEAVTQGIFNENGIFFTNNITSYESQNRLLFNGMNDARIHACLQVLMKDENGQTVGMLTFSSCNMRSVKFDNQAPMLSIIAADLLNFI